MWDPVARLVSCLGCAAAAPVASDPPAQSPPVARGSDPLPPPSSVAGASARAENERRQRAREERIDRKFGRFAGIVKFLVEEPQSTQAWLRGSKGERKLAEGFSQRVGDRAVLLHHRRIPRSRANIDHLAVAASGVWVIDAKRYKGLVERRDVGGWSKVDNGLYVGGRDRSKLVAGVQRQVDVVRSALGLEPGDDSIPVTGACASSMPSSGCSPSRSASTACG